MRDWRFRNALNYAIDKQRLCDVADEGLAQPATTIINPDTWVNPDYHWQPPASKAYTFDLAKANQLHTAAGYPLKNGVRLDKQGKPIALRLMTSTDQAGCQIEVKLISGWLQQLGITTTIWAVDYGTFLGDIYNAHGSGWAPNFNLAVSWWTGYYDPGVTLNCLTTGEIGSLDEPYWSNGQYDKLAVEQASTIDPLQRRAIIYHMQQLSTSSRPGSRSPTPTSSKPSTQPSGRAGRQLWGTGPAWQCEGNLTSYLNLRPRAYAASTTGGGSSTARDCCRRCRRDCRGRCRLRLRAPAAASGG